MFFGDGGFFVKDSSCGGVTPDRRRYSLAEHLQNAKRRTDAPLQDVYRSKTERENKLKELLS